MTREADNADLTRAVQDWLGVTQDGWAGDVTMRAFRAKTGAAKALPAAMKTSATGVALIHGFETFESDAYRDPGSDNGLPITIGWGSTRDEAGSPIKLGAVWTRERADARFYADLGTYERGVQTALAGAPATQAQFDALVSFAYNVGTQALRGSTLARLHRAGDYAGARAQFARWDKNDGKKMAGLVRRRAAEAELYRDAS